MTTIRTCLVEECGRTDIRAYGWCAMHYKRWWKTGSTDPRCRDKRECAIADCVRTDIEARGWCRKHYDRWRIHGDPQALGYPRGRANTRWTDSPLYNAAHKRVRRVKGPAKDHLCVECGAQAGEWSYDHADAGELMCESGMRYSADPSHYEPRCISCHRRADAAWFKRHEIVRIDCGES